MAPKQRKFYCGDCNTQKRRVSPCLPSEVELPVEAAPGHVGGGHILKGVIADHIDDRTYHAGPAHEGSSQNFSCYYY